MATEKRLTIIIQNGDKTYMPAVQEGVTWDLTRKGAPGTLSFKVLRDDVLNFEEGNEVQMSWGSTNLFKGYIFTHSEDKNGLINITAYDQLRYLKNQEVYIVVKTKASTLIQQICDDFKLVHKKDGVEAITDTKYEIPRLRGSNSTLFDIIQLALDHTLMFEGVPDEEAKDKGVISSIKKLYVLYDDFGVVTLKEIGELDVPILIDAETAQNFNFESSINSDVYNRIKVYVDDKQTGKHDEYVAYNSANEKRWGILQKVESFNEKRVTGPRQKADRMLLQYNHARKRLSIKGAFGDCRVRAGSRVWVKLDVKDPDVSFQTTSNSSNSSTSTESTMSTMPTMSTENKQVNAVQMLVEAVKHKWNDGDYTMDLTLVGRGVTK